jgi:RNA polymerase sigma-70 factor, ECF subfamily
MAAAAATPIEVTETATGARLDFGTIVRENQAMVFGIAWHFLQDRHLAEELAQDVFLQLHTNLERVESAVHATHWLRRVTTHRCIDSTRKRNMRGEVSLEEAPEPRDGKEPGDPMLRRRLQQLVASLPEKQRAAVILRYQEDLEPEEIGRVLNLPVRTVKSTLHRALGLLREKAARMLKEAH